MTPTNALTIPTTTAAVVKRLIEYQHKARGALSSNTERALKADTAIFTAWCVDQGRQGLPASPDTVARFVDAQAAIKAPATVRRYASSISRLHRAAGFDDPTKAEDAKLALRRMARANGVRQKQAAPLNRSVVDRLIAAAADGPRDLRNIALLAVQYDTLCRRSELVALDLEDLAFAEDDTGTALIRRSKTDQAGEGAVRFLAADTVEHIKRWIDVGGVDDGALFRAVHKGGKTGGRLNDRDVPRILKGMAGAAGLDLDLSGHSCRVGCAQDMVAAGFSLPEVMQAGGWKSASTVARYSEHLIARKGAAAKLAARQNRA